ncbi:riboflavin synthase [Alicyclobacillus tolerans]|uniref:riboflavin synthase n=1 Tax=Alicyclobacillus tolerans TaxID=90970 RepID=UPI001F1B78C9|nr:riboflavin synthase [Alicyclobacillus tolerans]MCF8566173.1 riboflavin synthase [Alicyclobacillus tolerans]
MFTGLVEEIAIVQKIEHLQDSARIQLKASRIMTDMRLGDSIAVNGVCLTVVKHQAASFAVDAVPETLRRSNLGRLKTGDKVNVERALRVGDRFGGHIVAGHVDGLGVLRDRSQEGLAAVLTIETDEALLRYVVEKGSICIDGVSLTVMDTTDKGFRISIIPHTGAHTTLLDARPGTLLNLEVDVIAKYVEKLALGYRAPGGTHSGAHHSNGESGDVINPESRGISLETLQRLGFA